MTLIPAVKWKKAVEECLVDVISARTALDSSTDRLASALRSYHSSCGRHSSRPGAQSTQECVIRVRTDGTIRFEDLDLSFCSSPIR